MFIGQREKLELAREKMWSRIHLTPLLQAEEDRDQVRRYYADLAREKELLGSQSGAYNSDRYVFARRDVLFNARRRRDSSLREFWNCEILDWEISKREANRFDYYRFVRPTHVATPTRTVN